MIGIYKITSPSNKVYIGQSVNIERRKREYSNVGCKGQILLYNSINKYGWLSHKFEVVCECEDNELNDKERYYQDLFSCVGKKGLNLRLTKSSDRSGFISNETKEKISKKLFGNKIPKEVRDKMSKNNSKFWLNKNLSKEHKENLSLAKKGKTSNACRVLIDISNGVFYTSVREASNIYGIKETTLIMQLSGVNKHKTNLRYA